MLYPQSNPFRQSVDLSGFWDLYFDLENTGESQGRPLGFSDGRPAAVPASWNEQFEDNRDFLGPTWYQTRFDLPFGWDLDRQRAFLRFNSVNYLAEVWLNGRLVGSHEGGHLPFEFDVTPHLQVQDNLLVVMVEGFLAPDRVPPGNLQADTTDIFSNFLQNLPPASFDFFPFCGIHRPVLLYTAAPDAVADITVQTEIMQQDGLVRVVIERAEAVSDAEVTVQVKIKGHGAEISQQTQIADKAEMELRVANAALWAPGSPNLYELTVELVRDGKVFDRYTLQVGIRTIQVSGDQILLNGQPVYLQGFGRHEDFPVIGRGLMPAAIIKDYAMMQWVGANSFRTTHYPYSEQMMDLADRLGFLVIDETPAVGLFFAEQGLERRLELCQQYLRELIGRDKNHPSVIMWSLANEPHSNRPSAKPFFRDLYDLTKSLDPTRPATVVSYVGSREEAFEFCDVLAINRYNGWYSESGRIELGCEKLSQELDEIYARFHKPLILAEFGADTVAGHHSQPPEMFSEEYQADMLEQYIRLLRSKPYVVGEHVWNLCDFKTSQGVVRVNGLNLKGVFTRDRRPKLAAHRLRALWK
jgi:beta-glucuronidase